MIKQWLAKFGGKNYRGKLLSCWQIIFLKDSSMFAVEIDECSWVDYLNKLR
jgi:hypothetical protein